jgi:hypothetical protein
LIVAFGKCPKSISREALIDLPEALFHTADLERTGMKSTATFGRSRQDGGLPRCPRKLLGGAHTSPVPNLSMGYPRTLQSRQMTA